MLCPLAWTIEARIGRDDDKDDQGWGFMEGFPIIMAHLATVKCS
jgi:hypothetical protein